MITLLLVIPLIGSFCLLPFRENSPSNISKMKQIALATSLLNLFVSVLLWIEFDYNSTDYQFVYEFKELSFCHLNVGVDGTSLYFVLLTTFITPICLLSNWTDITEKIKYFLISFLILETLQIAVFVVLDLLLFYIFFESVLIPLFIIILTWGASTSRIRAAFLLFLYTLFGSLFMLLAIMTIYHYLGSTDFQLISLTEISLESQKWLWLSPSFSKRDMTNRLIHSSNSTLNTRRECKSLVVYMSTTSMDSTLKYKGFTSRLREMCKIPVHLHSIIVGVLLSDGWLYKNKSGKTLLALKQTNFEYLWLVYTRLSHYCRSLPRTTKTNINGKNFTCVMFATRVYPCFTEWYDMFYQEGKKIVPLDLYNMLTYEALAHWIMGDGTKVNRGLTLQTQSFTIQECVFIISILIYKFNIKCSIHMQRNQPTIYISSKSMDKLRPLILPYMCQSMMYKIGIGSK
jgi:NADH-ubiquinone oxidoreductase chain 4